MSRAYRKIIYSGLAILLFAITTSCNTKTEWQTVKYDKFLSNDYFGTQCETNHQGEHQLSKSHVYQDGDTLIILFPAELPAYWGSMTVKVFDGKCNAQFDGIPFMQIDLEYETLKQMICLQLSMNLVNH